MKFYLHKLGCPKNDVDADYISARLIAEGHQPVADPEQADSVIVNTCGFILPAREESINELLRLGQLKKAGNVKTLYATGCLSQRNGDELLEGMPELDGAFGLGALDAISDAVSSSSHLKKTIKIEPRKLGYLDFRNRFIDDDNPFAYLKISDGCNRMCSYCAIPSIRGKFRSRPVKSILKEAEFLASNGKKEIILVSQEATVYGLDSGGRPRLVELLKELEHVDGIEWIRPMYLHPAKLTPEIVEYMTADNKTLNYFDLPLQHISDPVLTAMNRKVSRKKIEALLASIRNADPAATIRTTFIVGFPGETEADFDELKNFVADFEFDRMGAFVYSTEEGTAAEGLADHVPEEVKSQRLDELMMVQQEIAFTANNDLIGSRPEVIIDSVADQNQALGRMRSDCPDIDQEITVTGTDLKTGDICQVAIESAEGYDLFGRVIEG